MRNYLITLLGGITEEAYNKREKFWQDQLRDVEKDKIDLRKRKDLYRDDKYALMTQLAQANEQILVYEHEKAEIVTNLTRAIVSPEKSRPRAKKGKK